MIKRSLKFYREDQEVIKMVNRGPGPGGELPVVAVKHPDGRITAVPSTSAVSPMPRTPKKIGCLTSTLICGIISMVLIWATAQGYIHPAISGCVMLGMMAFNFLKED